MKYDEIIAGTNTNKNPELPAPKKIIGHSNSDVESGQIEVPLTGGVVVPLTKPIPLPKPRVKREIFIREIDNGFIMTAIAGDFREEWAMINLKKLVKTIMTFLSAQMEEE